MKRKRKDELVERGPIVEDEAITTINIPRYLNESKQEYSDRIKLRIKLAAIALRKDAFSVLNPSLRVPLMPRLRIMMLHECTKR